MSEHTFQPPPEVPPEITFVTIPLALAQFHHLPLHVPIWLHRQEAVEKNGYDFQQGYGAMEELLKAAPDVPGAYLFQLFVRKWPKLMAVGPYFESGRIAEAIPKLVEVLDIDPECPLTCFQLGYCFRATGELEKSESFYRKALRMAPDAGWIYSNLGRTYQAMGDKPRAVEAYWEALELLPNDRFVLERLVEMGEIFLVPQKDKEGDPAVAFVRKEDYEKKVQEMVAKEKDPGNLLKYGWKLLQDRLVDMAGQCFQKALSLDAAQTEGLLGLGTAHLEAGRYKDAERSLTEYLDGHPGSAAAHLNLFKAYLAQDETDLAWEEIQTAVRLDPDRVDALRQLYFFFRETERKEEGLEWLDQLAEENPQSFAPLLVKAQAYSDDQDWAQEEGALKLALRRSPHNEEVLLFYTSEMGKKGLHKELVELLEKEPKPFSFSLTVNLALAYSHTGQMDESRKMLQDFLERPDISPVDRQRAQELLKELKRPL